MKRRAQHPIIYSWVSEGHGSLGRYRRIRFTTQPRIEGALQTQLNPYKTKARVAYAMEHWDTNEVVPSCHADNGRGDTLQGGGLNSEFFKYQETDVVMNWLCYGEEK